MTATVNKTTAISQNENTTQAQEWTLIPTCETIEYGETCKTPTGHYVKVKTTHQPSSISLVIEVFNEYGHVTACTAFLGGIDHEECYEAFYKGYMESPSLQLICKHFDELCTPYDEDEE